jgi:hypothetical protein
MEASPRITRQPGWVRLLAMINAPVMELDESALRTIGMVGIATFVNAIALAAWAIPRMRTGQS